MKGSEIQVGQHIEDSLGESEDAALLVEMGGLGTGRSLRPIFVSGGILLTT